MGYDKLNTLAKFTNDDLAKVTNFMTKTLHKILLKKARGDEDEYMKSLKLVYGEFYMYAPEEYEILGGHAHNIQLIVDVAHKIVCSHGTMQETMSKSRNNRGKSSSSVSTISPGLLTTSSSHKTDVPSDDTILAEKTMLENNLKSWLDANNESETETYDSDRLQAIVSFAAGAYVAAVTCPIGNYKVTFEIKKIRNRWSPSNFYRHIKRHKPKPRAKRQNTLKTMFLKAPVENSVSDSDESTSPKKRRSSLNCLSSNVEIEENNNADITENQEENFQLAGELME